MTGMPAFAIADAIAKAGDRNAVRKHYHNRKDNYNEI